MARHWQLISLLLGVLGAATVRAARSRSGRRSTCRIRYYREMYLTSGPSSAAWRRTLARCTFSIGGSLWRQKIDSSSAEQ